MKKILTSLVGVMSVVAVANAEPYVGLNLIYDNIQLDKSFGETISIISETAGIGTYETKDLFSNNYFGASIDAGYQFNDYIGAEAYFQYNFESKTDVSISGHEFLPDGKIWDSKSNFMSGGLDIMGYLPLNSCHSFSLIGTIGGGYYYFKNKTDIPLLTLILGDLYQFDTHEHHFGLRMGAGFQYNFNESMSVRALGRYVMWKHDDSYTTTDTFMDDFTPVNGMWEGSIGIQYKF
ncbi:MAG: porin family protein [Alphaproteobacteria bacterium]|nr:porin family protein [Alphaproteobacteria bacterium]